MQPADPQLTYRQRLRLAWVLVVGALVALVVACSSCVSYPPLSSLDGAVDPTVAQLITPTGFCTAWRATDDMLVTAGHCCEPTEVYTLLGSHAEVGVLTVVVDDDEADVCVLRGTMKGVPLKLAPLEPKPGERVWTAGWPVGRYMISTGRWSGHHGNRAMASLTVAPGASGSPIFDQRGAVVGMCSSIAYPGIMGVVTLADLRATITRALAPPPVVPAVPVVLPLVTK